MLKVSPAKTLFHFPTSSHPSGRHVATVESAKTLRGGPKAMEYVEDRKAPQLFAKKNMLGPKIKSEPFTRFKNLEVAEKAKGKHTFIII